MHLDDLLANLPMDQLAGQLGVAPDQAEAASRQALGALVGGMEANAQDPGGASSLLEALGQHADRYQGQVDLDQVDTEDGQKIVNHVFGDQTDAVVSQLGGLLGGGRKG